MNKLKLLLISGFFCFQISAQTPIEIDSKIYTPKQLHKDIDYTLMKYKQIHPNFYRDLPKDSVVTRFEYLKSEIDKPMTRFDFMRMFTPVVYNVIRDGHNYVYPLEEEQNHYIDNGGKFFPIPVIIKNKRLFCNSKIAEIPYYSEIIGINNLPSQEVIETVLSNYYPENEESEEVFASNSFSSTIFCSYWHSYGGFNEYSIDYISSLDSSKHNLILKGRTSKEIDSLRISQSKDKFTFEEIPELKTGVLAIRTMEGINELKSFCDSVFVIMKQRQYENLVIDIRGNSGGSSRTVDMFLEYITDKPVSQFDYFETKASKEQKKDFVTGNRKYKNWFKWYNYLYYPIYIRSNDWRKQMLLVKNGTLIRQDFEPTVPKDNPLRFDGNLFLLTSISSYSAANGLASAFKYYKLGPIIGQETGQPTYTTINSINFELPNTKITCASSDMTIAYIGWKNDGHGVIPDYVIDKDIYSDSNTDKELEFVKELIIKNQ